MPMNAHHRMGDGAFPTGSNPTPDAYAYDAALHCPQCTEARFGRNSGGYVACEPNDDPCVDGEGNEVAVVMPWDWDRDDYSREHGEYCDTCGREIIAPDNPATRAAAAGLTIHTYAYSRGDMLVNDPILPGFPVILRMRNPRPDADRPGGFVWDLELWDPWSVGPVVALWEDFAPSPMLRPMEDPVDAARVFGDAAALAAHALRYDTTGEPREMADAQERLADRLDDIAGTIAG